MGGARITLALHMADGAHTDRWLAELARGLPSDAVRTDADVLAAHAHDESETRPVTPDCVVVARTTADVAHVMKTASAHGVPVTPRGAGTSRTGGAVPVAGGIVLAFEAMRALRGIEKDDLYCVTEPGLVLQDLHTAVEREGLFYGPDPSSLGSCTLGGNVASNAGGPRAFKYGVTRDAVLGLEVVTAEGTVLKLGRRTKKGVTGYDLTALVVGSEGTLAVVTEITLALRPLPEAVTTLLVLLPDVAAAGRAVSRAIARGVTPRCLELLDAHTLAILRPRTALSLRADAGALLLVEVDGDAGSIDAQTEKISAAFDDAGALEVLVARDGAQRDTLWSARRDMSRALRQVARFKLSEDVVVPRSRLPALLDHVRVLSEKFAIRMPAYGHAGDGNLHVNLLWDDPSEKPRVDAAIGALFEEVIRLGGTLSGEHGIGTMKARYLPLEQSPALIALEERVKATFDPKGVLNPGKIFPGAWARFHSDC